MKRFIIITITCILLGTLHAQQIAPRKKVTLDKGVIHQQKLNPKVKVSKKVTMADAKKTAIVQRPSNRKYIVRESK